MTEKEHRPRYHLVFEALPDAIPPWHRLKALLKGALRELKLRCLRAIIADDADTQTPVLRDTASQAEREPAETKSGPSRT